MDLRGRLLGRKREETKEEEVKSRKESSSLLISFFSIKNLLEKSCPSQRTPTGSEVRRSVKKQECVNKQERSYGTEDKANVREERFNGGREMKSLETNRERFIFDDLSLLTAGGG